MNKFFLFTLSLLIMSCGTLDKRFVNAEDVEHPAVQVFLDYREKIKQKQAFNDLIEKYFDYEERIIVRKSIGWKRLVYSSSYKALSNGDCDKISIINKRNDRILLQCEGEYLHKSIVFGEQTHSMNLKVYIIHKAGQWYISRSGLLHSFGETNKFAYGLKL